VLWAILGVAISITLYVNGVPIVRSIFVGIAVALLGPIFSLHPLTALALWIVLGIIGGRILAQKGYPPFLGVLAGLIFGPLGLIVAHIAPQTGAGRQMAKEDELIESELDAARDKLECPKCGRENASTSRFCPRCNYRFT
jgi:hypothetical protein